MSNKLPLVLIPGLACTQLLFEEQVASLGGEREVIVADHSGHDSFGDIARSILAQAPERFALTGLSMGGYLAFELLRQEPQRIERLALLDTSARADTAEKITERKRAIALVDAGRYAQICRASLPFLIARSRQGDRFLEQKVMQMAKDTGADAWRQQTRALMSRPSSIDLLPQIACPTLVLVGDKDELTPLDCALEMAAGIPNAQLEVVPDCGHLSSLERPELVTEHLRRWLDAN